MTRRRKEQCGLVIVVLVALTCSAQSAFGQSSLPKPTYTSYIDWARNQITVDARVNVSSLGSMIPDARIKAEQEVSQDRSKMIESTLFGIQADSFHTVGDLAAASPQIVTALQSILQPKDQQYAKLSTDLSNLTIQYQLPIFPNLGGIFVNQVKPNPPAPLLTYVPTTKFSGIVIYAKGNLPIHGENKAGKLVPSLFPRIWDSKMDLIASADTIDPQVLRTRGMVGFSNSTDEKPFTSRIGLVPFRTVAVGLFGKSPTDVIISNEAADRILASPDNIKLLTEGRILIIADLPNPGVTSGG